MQVTILQATENPVDLISMAAGICYGKDNVSTKRAEHCFNNGHMSVFEHAYVTFKIDGISRACLAQLYCMYDLAGYDWYVVPPKIASNECELAYYRECMSHYAYNFRMQLASNQRTHGTYCPRQLGLMSDIIMTCNLRELYHILGMHMSQSAQWEIRELAFAMFNELQQHDEQWQYLMDLWKKEDD